LIVAKDESLDEKLKDIVLFHMAGLAVVTLLINGSTLGVAIRILGLSTQSAAREKLFGHFLSKICKEIDH